MTQQNLLFPWFGSADPAVVLAHAVPHAVVPQLLRPLVAETLPTDEVSILSKDDAARYVSTIEYCTGFLSDSAIDAAQEFPALTTVIFDQQWINEEVLGNLCRLTRVNVLVLKDSYGLTEHALQHLPKLTQLRTLDLSSCESITDAGVKHIGLIPTLEELDVSNDEDVTTVGVHHLVNLRRLRKLRMQHCRSVTSEALSSIAQLPELHILDVRYCDIDDCSALSGHPTLETLYLNGENELSVESVRSLASLPRLTTLHLDSRPADDEFLAAVASIGTLTSLSFSGSSAIDSNGFRHFEGPDALPRLKELDLSDSSSMDLTGLKHLVHLRNLRALLLWGVRLDTAAMQILATIPQLTALDVDKDCVDGAAVEEFRKNAHHVQFTCC